MKPDNPAPKFVGINFSVGMLTRAALDAGVGVAIEPLTLEEAKVQANACLASYRDPSRASAVSYRNSVDVLNSVLGTQLVQNRGKVLLEPGDVLLLCQFEGERLGPWDKALSDGVRLDFYRVTIIGG